MGVCEMLQCYKQLGGNMPFISAPRALTLDTCVMSFLCRRRGSRGERGHLWRIRMNCVSQNSISVWYQKS